MAKISTRSEIRKVAASLDRQRVTFSCETIPYVLATADALIILLFCLFGAFFYHWIFDSPIPDLAAYVALGLIASFIHIARLGGRGYYDFERAAKPGVEIVEVLISWFSTGLMLASLPSCSRSACRSLVERSYCSWWLRRLV